MKAIKLNENIYWVGAIDYKLRLFHGYSTERGTTYNAYLIVDDEITLVDTVKAPFFGEMLQRISSVVDPCKISKIICNHVEQDHSGSLPMIKQIAKDAKVYASAPHGVNGLKIHYGIDDVIPVKTGEKVSLGKTSLEFLQTPMIHWPDNMFSYHEASGTLFSNDAFGQHYATNKILDSENDLREILFQAKKYYANIVLPYGMQVKRTLSEASKLNFSMIATSHGVVWKNNIKNVIDLYNQIISNDNSNKALIVYDTMWGATEKIAKALVNNFVGKGYEVKLMDLQNNHISDVITEVMDAKYIAVGSPTLNNGLLPTVASFLCYLKGLAPQNKIGIAFGAYGWGGQSLKIIQDALNDCKFKQVCEPIKTQYVPTEKHLKEIEEVHFD